MKMFLKNKNNKKKKKLKILNFKIDKEVLKKIFTYKNLLIFLVSFLIINLIIGIIFYLHLNDSDKIIINSNITNYFKVNDSYNYLNIFKNSLINNIGNGLLIWLLGISVIGIIIVIFIYFSETFSIGFSIASIFGAYKTKGIIGLISYLFPSKLGYLIMLFIIIFHAIRFSSKIIRYLFLKHDIDLRIEFKKYIKILIIIILIGLTISLFETFLNPLMNRFFNLF